MIRVVISDEWADNNESFNSAFYRTTSAHVLCYPMKTRGRCFWNDRLHPIGYLIVIVAADWVLGVWRSSAKSDAGQAPPGSSISILICVRERREDFALLGSKLWAKSFISLRTRPAPQSPRGKMYIRSLSLQRLLSLTYSARVRMLRILF